MKSWLDRIDAARANGAFTDDDQRDIRDYETCMVGEVTQRVLGLRVFGPQWTTLPDDYRMLGLAMGWTKSHEPIRAISRNDFDEAEQLLHAIEDRALAIKRERGHEEMA